MSPEDATPPCWITGHAWVLYSDGAQQCATCRTYRGPCAEQVNALLTRASGVRAYGRTMLVLPKAPPVPAPTELPPPVLPAMPSLWVLMPIAAFLLACAAFAIGAGLRAIL